MNTAGVHVLAGFLFFFLVVIFGLLPFLVLRRCFRRSGSTASPRIITFLHSMASGVLLATCLLSLLPEAIEAMHKALGSSHTLLGKREIVPPQQTANFTTSSSNKTHTGDVFLHHAQNEESVEGNDKGFYPLAELLIAIGFLTIYVIDSCVKSLGGTVKRSSGLAHSSQEGPDEVVLFQRGRRKESDSDDLYERAPMSNHGSSPTAIRSTNRPRWLKPQFSNDFEPLIEDSEKSIDTVAFLGDQPGSGRNVSAVEEHPTTDKLKGRAGLVDDKSIAFRSMALITALCIHGFFDGVLLGLQTSVHVLLSLMFALSIHKMFVSLSLSLTLFNNHGRDLRPCRAFLYFLCFAMTAPFGLAISAEFIHRTVGVSESGESSLVPGSLQAFAVGTFMYVTFTETTGHNKGRSIGLQVTNHIFLLVGFALMAGLRAALGEV